MYKLWLKRLYKLELFCIDVYIVFLLDLKIKKKKLEGKTDMLISIQKF